MNNFTFFSNFLTAVEDLSKTDQKELIWAICRIGCGEDFEKIASEMKPYLKAILKSLRFDLESTKSKHLGNSKGGKNSKGGGRPNNLKLKTTQNKLKTTQNNEIEMEIEMEIEKKKENIKEKTGTEKSLVDNFPTEEMETYAKSKRLPFKVIETMKEDYLLWIQSNPTKKECKNRDMAATIKQWVSRDIKGGKLVPKKTDQEMIAELEAEYGKIEA